MLFTIQLLLYILHYYIILIFSVINPFPDILNILRFIICLFNICESSDEVYIILLFLIFK